MCPVEPQNSRSGALPGLVAASAIGVRCGLPAEVTPKVTRRLPSVRPAHYAGSATAQSSGYAWLGYKSLRVKAVAHVLADVF